MKKLLEINKKLHQQFDSIEDNNRFFVFMLSLVGVLLICDSVTMSTGVICLAIASRLAYLNKW